MLARPDFVSCYGLGARIHSRHFILFVQNIGNEYSWQLGLAVSRKCGCAVRRNRIKRILREFFRINQNHIPPHSRIVVVPKRSLDVSKINLAMVTSELLPVLAKIAAPENVFRPKHNRSQRA